jgi:predicted PurR-regulated permease PerM
MKLDNPSGNGGADANGRNPQFGYEMPPLIGVVVTIAALYYGKDIFLPLAIAVLLTFALAPVVFWLQKARFPRVVAVVTVAASAFAAIFLFGAVVTSQLGTLAGNLPIYQTNIETKMKSVQKAAVGRGVFDQIARLLDRMGHQIEADSQGEAPKTAGRAEEPASEPLPVTIVEPRLRPVQLIQTIIGPLLQPMATGGIIIVLVFFMLLRREDLRDRFISLVGAGDLNRTTIALQDAGYRVGQYLLMQLIVNVTYAIPVSLGLWIIGVPNALLWGMLTLVLRFVPYFGPIIGSIFPLALALAVDPGWSMVLWTLALFIVLELVSNNVVEPWLYGLRTGLSPLAIIVAAIFWTWLWGVMGLLLSTPLTVCLVVLGRHVPRFEFLDILFGNQPVLQPHEQLYQRLLANDPDEATERAEKIIEESSLLEFYETIAIPALALGEQDRAGGVMTDERRKKLAVCATILVDNLLDYALEEAAARDRAIAEPMADDLSAIESGTAGAPAAPAPDTGNVILCAGGRGDLDDAAASMLSQVLTANGATARVVGHEDLQPGHLKAQDLNGIDTIVIGFLNAGSVVHARNLVRRLKRSRKSLRVGVVFWGSQASVKDDTALLASIHCDFLANSMASAMAGALQA